MGMLLFYKGWSVNKSLIVKVTFKQRNLTEVRVSHVKIRRKSILGIGRSRPCKE